MPEDLTAAASTSLLPALDKVADDARRRAAEVPPEQRAAAFAVAVFWAVVETALEVYGVDPKSKPVQVLVGAFERLRKPLAS